MPLKTRFLAVKKVSTQRKIHVHTAEQQKTPIFLMCEFSIRVLLFVAVSPRNRPHFKLEKCTF